MANSPLKSMANRQTQKDISRLTFTIRLLTKGFFVKSLTNHTKAIPSSVDQQSMELKHVIAARRANGYPKRLVIHASKPKQPSQQTPATAPDDKKGFCILPYVKGTTEPIKRILSNYNVTKATSGKRN